MVVFLGCECTLLDHVEFLINQYSQVLLFRAALNPFCAQPVLLIIIVITTTYWEKLFTLHLDYWDLFSKLYVY